MLAGIIALMVPDWATVTVMPDTAPTASCQLQVLDGETGKVGSTLYQSRFCDGHRECAVFCMTLFIIATVGVAGFVIAAIVGAIRVSQHRSKGGSLFTAACWIGIIAYAITCVGWMVYSNNIVDLGFLDFSCTGWPFYLMAIVISVFVFIIVGPMCCCEIGCAMDVVSDIEKGSTRDYTHMQPTAMPPPYGYGIPIRSNQSRPTYRSSLLG